MYSAVVRVVLSCAVIIPKTDNAVTTIILGEIFLNLVGKLEFFREV